MEESREKYREILKLTKSNEKSLKYKNLINSVNKKIEEIKDEIDKFDKPSEIPVAALPLNPLRAYIVQDLNQFDRYPFSGHSQGMGKTGHVWQDSEAARTVVSQFTKSD